MMHNDLSAVLLDFNSSCTVAKDDSNAHDKRCFTTITNLQEVLVSVSRLHLELRSQLWGSLRRAGESLPIAPAARITNVLQLWEYQEEMTDWVCCV
jgi:hypothetical protein